MRNVGGRGLTVHAVAMLLAHVCGAGSASAQELCPAQAEIGKTIVLAVNEGRRAEITWLDEGKTRIAEQKQGSPTFPRETLAVGGLIATELTRPSAKIHVSYDIAPETLFPLALGQQRQLAFTADPGGREPIKGRLTIAVVEFLRHEIGKCRYEALLVGTMIEFDDGRQAPARYDVYIPTLLAVVKSTTFDTATNTILEAESFEFDTIAPK